MGNPKGKLRPKSESRRSSEYDRLQWLAVGVALITVAMIAKLFDLQVVDYGFYTALAKDQHELVQDLLPVRGKILIKERGGGQIADQETLYPAAQNHEVNFVYSIPKRMRNRHDAAEKLSPLVGVLEETLYARFSKKDDLYEPVAHGVDEETRKKIEELKIPGIAFIHEPERFYPEGEFTSHLTGFLGFSNNERKGQYGIEQAFEKLMRGKVGSFQGEHSAGGEWIGIGDTEITEAEDGSDIVLTVDRAVQFFACKSLAAAVEKTDAKKGTVILMNPQKGEILAMCNAPMFDPNHYSDVEDVAIFSNDAVSDSYEPGSVMKPMAMAMALNENKVTPETIHSDTGAVKIGKYTIRNFDDRVYGQQTMTQVLENSINTGAIEVARRVGPEDFEQYMKEFGFGEKTGIELPSERSGNISTLAAQKEIYMATASYGQGITVTPLQLISAYAAIANGGKLMKPYVVDEIRKSDGTVARTEAKVIRQVISPQTAKTLTAMLASVVKNGGSKGAALPGYHVAGKTGTAQVPASNGQGYDPNKHKDTFVGIFPATNPQIVMLVKIDLPSAGRVAGVTAVPVFRDIADFVTDYYQIPPDAAKTE